MDCVDHPHTYVNVDFQQSSSSLEALKLYLSQHSNFAVSSTTAPLCSWHYTTKTPNWRQLERKNKPFNQHNLLRFKASSCSVIQLSNARAPRRKQQSRSSGKGCQNIPDPAHHRAASRVYFIFSLQVTFILNPSLQPPLLLWTTIITIWVPWIIHLPQAFLCEPPGLRHLGAGAPYIMQYIIRSALLCNINASSHVISH